MIIVNFKRYVSGEQAVGLARVCKRVGEEMGVRIIVCPQLSDLAWCVETGAECWAQKYEPEARGNKGTLLNHSDYRIDRATLERTLLELEGVEICVCAVSVKEAINLSGLEVNYVAFEPPALIGNREKSVSSEEPEEIREIVLSAQCSVLIGAGVHSAQDVKVGLAMGAKGVLVATDVVKAADPEKELRELAEAFESTRSRV